MKLQTKILALSLPLAAAGSLFVSAMGRRVTQSVMVEELGRRIRPQIEDSASRIAVDLQMAREQGLLAGLQSIQAFSGANYAEALTVSGTVVAHTNVLEKGKQRTDMAIRQAMSADETLYIRNADSKGAMLLVSSPVWQPDDEFLLSPRAKKRIGTLRLAIPLRPTLESSQRVGELLAGLYVGVTLLALLFSLLLLKIILGPVQAIVDATSRVSAGDYGVVVPVVSRDELGSMAESFNRMSSVLSRTAVSRDRLEEALAITRAALEASADGILVVDKDLRVVTYNQPFVEMWGLTDELMRSRDVRRMAEFSKNQLEDPESFMRLVTLEVSSSADLDRRDMLRLKDGRLFDRVSKPFRISGQLVGRTVTTRDLTLHLEGVRALASARDEALETTRIKSQFLATISHELRTPLNSVIASAELLKKGRLDTEQAEYAETLTRAARALLDLLNGVLDFSKIEAGRMTIEHAHLTPAEILQDAASLLRPRAVEKGLRLDIDTGSCGDWPLFGDPTRLRQVLLNLISNAIKFTERGDVQVRVHPLSRKVMDRPLDAMAGRAWD